MTPGQEAMATIYGLFFDLLDNNSMLSVFIRMLSVCIGIASTRRF